MAGRGTLHTNTSHIKSHPLDGQWEKVIMGSHKNRIPYEAEPAAYKAEGSGPERNADSIC